METLVHNPGAIFRGSLLLQRLPGLGIDQNDVETRHFIDSDFADACRGGDLVEYIINPHGVKSTNDLPKECAIGSLGISITAKICHESKISDGKILASLLQAVSSDDAYTVADLIALCIIRRIEIQDAIYIKGVLLGNVNIQNICPI